MANYTIPRDTENWDVPLNADLVDIDSRLTSGENKDTIQDAEISTNSGNISTLQGQMTAVTTTANNAVPKGTLVVNVQDYGANPGNTGDQAAAINSAITALGAQGGVLYFPPGDYRLGGSANINLTAPITLQGAGPGSTTIRLSSAFTGTDGIVVNSDSCVIQDIQIRGGSTTTTSNPAAHGVTATGVQAFRVLNSTFQWINGYAIRAIGTATATVHGGQVDNVKIQSCAGGIHVKSDTTNTAANFQMSNVFSRFTGVTSGTNANLDCIRVEDSWDVLCHNVIAWMNATTGGTGAAFRVKGDCAATFVQNLDALGPQTGAANVVIEGNGTTSPQNTQIQGGVIQQGIVGLLISDATTQTRIRNMRILHNQTHNVVVNNSGSAGNVEVYIDECALSFAGDGATGTNYDINWTGTAEGLVTDCRFGSAIVSTGTPGAQSSINISGATKVRAIDVNFSGTGASSSNWFSGATAPHFVTRLEGSVYELRQSANWVLPTSADRVSIRPVSSSNNALAITTGGTNDNFRIFGSGTQEFGAGGASARDTTWGRQGVAQIGTPDSDIFVNLAGKTLIVKNGTNAKAGTVVANGTTAVTVSTTAVTANSAIILSYKSGTQAATQPAWVSALTAGTSFQIKSIAGDTATYNWVVIEQA